MERFNITSPDGQKFTITAPDGATQDQVMQFAQSQFQAQAESQKKADWSANEMSGLDRVRAGIGSGLTSAARATAGFMNYTPLAGLNRMVHSLLPEGTPGRLPTDAELAAARAEAAKLDAPLMRTTGGKAGRVVGAAAAAAPAMLIPGGGTYLGSALIGGGTGVVQTEGGAEERSKGGAFGALGGLTAKGVSDVVGSGVSKLASLATANKAAAQTANAGRDAAVQSAREAGYVLPPNEANPGVINATLEGLSGKIKTAQAASAKNQATTNSLARKALGLADDAPLTVDTLNAVRSEAGKAYEAVASSGTITPGPKYAQALDAIVKDAKQAAKDFPSAKQSPLVDAIESIRSPQFDAASAVAKIRTLRDEASAAYAGGDKAMGKGLKDGAKALEDAIEEHLKSAGPDLLKRFRDARQLIAKTYSVESSLNKSTGDVSAQAMAGMLKRGKPLSGELQQVAEVGAAFPKATQSLQQAPGALSPLDIAFSVGTGNPLWALARPATRSAILSQPYQAAMVRPQTYDASGVARLAQLFQNDSARRLAAAAAAGATLPASQQ